MGKKYDYERNVPAREALAAREEGYALGVAWAAEKGEKIIEELRAERWLDCEQAVIQTRTCFDCGAHVVLGDVTEPCVRRFEGSVSCSNDKCGKQYTVVLESSVSCTGMFRRAGQGVSRKGER